MGWWTWALLSPDGVAPSSMVGVSASVNLPLHHKVPKFSSGTSAPGWSWKKGHKTVVVVVVLFRRIKLFFSAFGICIVTVHIMVALCNRADHYIFALWFLLLSSFFLA